MSYHTTETSRKSSSTTAIPQPDAVKRQLRDAGRKASYHANKLGADIWDVIGEHNHILPASTSSHVNDVVERNYDALKREASRYRGTNLGKALESMAALYDKWKRTGEYRR